MPWLTAISRGVQQTGQDRSDKLKDWTDPFAAASEGEASDSGGSRLMSITAENMQFEKGTIVTHENGVRASDISVPPRWPTRCDGPQWADNRVGWAVLSRKRR